MRATPILLLTLLAACQSPPQGHETKTHDGLYTIWWNTASGMDIEVDEYFVLRARVEPVPRTVTIDATMPEHRHGMLHEPAVRRSSNDTWLASDMLFHMPGLWRLHFDITDAEGTVHRAESDVVLE